MRNIKRIFVHCTASQQDISINQLLYEFKLNGWKYPGYHYVVDADGKTHKLLDERLVSNGVRGYNSTSINVAYIGGIDRNGKAIDNRTYAQKVAIRAVLMALHEKYPSAKILGHRDISPDKNNNGKVDSWERIKECPCFNAIEEYQDIQSS